jgi:hypothetical protein
LVLVEGSGDQAIVAAMIKHESLDGFHVHNMIGKGGWSAKIKAICLNDGFDDVTSLGLLRDADTNGQSQFDSCVSALTNAGLHAPTKTGELADGRPAVAIEIVPSIDRPGAVEELCLPSFDTTILNCVDAYFQCVGSGSTLVRAKPRVQTYLAGLKPHYTDLNVAARSGGLDLSHGTFDGLRAFLQRLHSV